MYLLYFTKMNYKSAALEKQNKGKIHGWFPVQIGMIKPS